MNQPASLSGVFSWFLFPTKLQCSLIKSQRIMTWSNSTIFRTNFRKVIFYLLFRSLSVCLSVPHFLAALGRGPFLERDHKAAGQTSLDSLPLTAGLTERWQGEKEDDVVGVALWHMRIYGPSLPARQNEFLSYLTSLSNLWLQMGHCPLQCETEEKQCVNYRSDSVSTRL